MFLMKIFLYFQAFVGYSLMMAIRFILTILFGPEEAYRRAQAATMEWVAENQEGIAAFMRILQSPVKVTMPEPEEPRPVMTLGPESDVSLPGGVRGSCVMPSDGCAYRVLQTLHPSSDPLPMYGFVITGPGLPPVVFVGPEPSFGPSVCAGLDLAYRAGRKEAPCPT